MTTDNSTEIQQLIQDIEQLKIQAAGHVAHLQSAQQRQQQLQAQISEAHERLELLTAVRDLLAAAQSIARQEFSNLLCSLATTALQSVFPDKKLRIEWRVARGREVADILIVDGEDEYEPALAGGGETDIISIAARVAALELHHPRPDGPLLLDEPFKHLSRDKSIARILEKLYEAMNRQIIMCTSHQHPEMATIGDRIFHVARVQEDGEERSVVTVATL